MLDLLEKLAKRYGQREGLFGIQPINEPVSQEMWEKMVYAHIEEKEYNRNPGESEEDRHNNEMHIMEAWAQVCDSAFDSIAVLLRIVDVIRNRQPLGRHS